MEPLISGRSRTEQVARVLLAAALTVLLISTVIDLVGSDDGLSVWNVLLLAIIVALLVNEVVGWIRAPRGQLIDTSSLDLDRVLAVRESDGLIAAVKEVRQQDSDDAAR